MLLALSLNLTRERIPVFYGTVQTLTGIHPPLGAGQALGHFST